MVADVAHLGARALRRRGQTDFEQVVPTEVTQTGATVRLLTVSQRRPADCRHLRPIIVRELRDAQGAVEAHCTIRVVDFNPLRLAGNRQRILRQTDRSLNQRLVGIAAGMSGNKIIRQRPVPAEAKAPVIWFFRSTRIQSRARDPALRPQFAIKKRLNVDDRGLRRVHRSVSSDVFGIGVSRQTAHGIVAHVAEADRAAAGVKFKSITVLLERAMSDLDASLDYRCRIGPASLGQFVRVKATNLFRVVLARVKELRASGIRLL